MAPTASNAMSSQLGYRPGTNDWWNSSLAPYAVVATTTITQWTNTPPRDDSARYRSTARTPNSIRWAVTWFATIGAEREAFEAPADSRDSDERLEAANIRAIQASAGPHRSTTDMGPGRIVIVGGIWR
jgi:hypothetical protein